MKVFTEHTHIVCIKTSGYVYANETIEELNKKPKLFEDLMTGEHFTAKDIIHIQNPKDNMNRKLAEFDYLNKNISFKPDQSMAPEIRQN